MFRSYRPIDDSLKEATLPTVKPAEITEEVEDQLVAGKQKHVMEQVDLARLGPQAGRGEEAGEARTADAEGDSRADQGPPDGRAERGEKGKGERACGG